MKPEKNHYATLGLLPDATAAKIKARFRELARRLHPDHHLGDAKKQAEQEFQAITEAFNVLGKPERRREHDAELARPRRESRGQDSDRVAHVYVQRGIKSFREKKWAQAAESFQRATHVKPENAQAWYYLALSCSQGRRWQEHGVQAIARACDLEPMNVDYLKLAGRIMGKAGLTSRAQKFYTEALRWGGTDCALEHELAQLKKVR